MKIDGHQRPWAASRLEQGIAPPRRPRSGGVTAAPRVPSQRRCQPGRAVIRTCRRCPCEAAPRCCVIVPREDLRGIPPVSVPCPRAPSSSDDRLASLRDTISTFFATTFPHNVAWLACFLFQSYSNKEGNACPCALRREPSAPCSFHTSHTSPACGLTLQVCTSIHISPSVRSRYAHRSHKETGIGQAVRVAIVSSFERTNGVATRFV